MVSAIFHSFQLFYFLTRIISEQVCSWGMVFFLIPNVAEKIFWFWWRKKKSDSEFLSYNLMLNSVKKICTLRDQKKIILTLVLSEKKILNEKKNHNHTQKWVLNRVTALVSGMILFSYLTDFFYFPLKIVLRKLLDMVRTGQKWPNDDLEKIIIHDLKIFRLIFYTR
jgi:hypothetical protein